MDLDVNLATDRLSGLETGQLDQRKETSATEDLQVSLRRDKMRRVKWFPNAFPLNGES